MKLRALFFISAVSLLISCKKSDDETLKTIRIGGLYSITGNWSSLGNNSQDAMRIALIDINDYLEQKGASFRFSTVMYDTRLDTNDAKGMIQTGFTKNGIRIFLGPQSSAECASVLNYANSNNLLVISQGSTASSLAIPNDALYRFCPGDQVEGQAIARSIYAAGKRAVISLARNDAGNIGLQQSVGNNFTTLGGQVDAITPYATTLTDFTAVINTLRTKIQQYSTSLGASKVAVYIASFDEAVNLFSAANNDPVLKSVNWYGGDGMVQSTALLTNSAARDFAVATSFFAPNFGLPAQQDPGLSRVSTFIKSLSGLEPDAYALSIYDAMWVIAKTYYANPALVNDATGLKTSFNTTANQHTGVTGTIQLNANGDRQAGSFDYWGIVNMNGTYIWKVVGKSL